jgi:hypothetical protein
MMRRAFAIVFLSSLLASQKPATANYDTESIEGWTVHVARGLRDEARGPAALELLRVKLFDITRAVPAAPLARLREVPIWLSIADDVAPCACYHPSADWLKEHGHDPAKAKGVEICNLENFLGWTHEQPSMVLHELTHAYHDRVLGYGEARVAAAFERAKSSGLYDSVLRYTGAKERHYALTNSQEFLAEMTESWFGTNDFWPFVRAELETADPETAKLLRDIWGG